MLLVQPLSTGRVFPFPFPTRKVSTLFKNDLWQFEELAQNTHKNIAQTIGTKSTRHTLHNFLMGLFVPPHKTHGLRCLLVKKHLKVFTKWSSLFFLIFHVKETEKPSTSQPDRLTLSHSDPPLFLLPYFFNTEKKQSLPSTPLHNFLKGLYFIPHKVHWGLCVSINFKCSYLLLEMKLAIFFFDF